MFRPMSVAAAGPLLTIEVDGHELRVRSGVSLALALMEAGIVPLRRTPVSAAPRAPLCLMGVCFECLCEVDGRQNVQSCMIEVTEGLRVRLAMGARRMEAIA
jgi:predicted molibdopterin-dependent oxidoreductase YjgC